MEWSAVIGLNRDEPKGRERHGIGPDCMEQLSACAVSEAEGAHTIRVDVPFASVGATD